MKRAVPFFELDRGDLTFWAATFGTALAFVAGIYLAARLLTPEGWVFSGFLHDSHDAYAYQAWSNYFSHRGLLVENPWGLPGQPPSWFNLVWFLLGRAMAAGVPYLVAYRALQLVAGAWLYLALLALMREFFRARMMAWCAYLLAGFGTGLSWLVYLCSRTMMEGKLIPGDIIHGDSFPIHTLWTFPHLALSFAMLTTIYLCCMRAVARGRRRWAAAGALVALAMGFSHPYHFATILPVLGAWYLALAVKHGRAFRRRWADLVVLLAGMVPGALYFSWLLKESPGRADWSGVSIVTATAGLPHVALGFGLILLLAVLGYRGFLPLARYRDGYLLAALWAIVNAAMHFSYPLIGFTQRLGEGLIVPLAVLGTWGFYRTVVPLLRRRPGDPAVEADVLEAPLSPDAGPEPLSDRARLRWAVALLILVLPDTPFHVANQLRRLRTGVPFFDQGVETKMRLRAGEAEALRFVARNVNGFPRFLSGPFIGAALPAHAPVRGLLGNVWLTPQYHDRLSQAAVFYGPTATEADRRQILARYGIDYVWWGADEDERGGKRPRGLPFLERVFGNGTVTVYRVDRAALAR